MNWKTFGALLARDAHVAKRNAMQLFLQTFLQPLMFVFIFGRVMVRSGYMPASYKALLLPGIMAISMVFTGISGGEFGIRGRVYALDSKTGNEIWRFYTVPGPNDVGGDSWPNDDVSYLHGGATVWQAPAIDPDLLPSVHTYSVRLWEGQ